MSISRSRRGTKLLGPKTATGDDARSDRFDQIEHKDILKNFTDPDNKYDDLSSIDSVANGFEKDKPIALFPVRLETKYIGDPAKLWIRIFPDDIVLKSHERPLTTMEQESGMNYWNEFYQANGDEVKERDAWERLVNVYGIERAAWIKKQMKPTNYPESEDEFDGFFIALEELTA